MLVPREGFEPTLDRLSTCCLCRWATSAGAAPRIRTGNLSLLKRAPLPCWASAAVKVWWRWKESNLRGAEARRLYRPPRVHNGLHLHCEKNLAEGGGVEPLRRVAPHHGFRDRSPSCTAAPSECAQKRKKPPRPQGRGAFVVLR